MNVNTMDFVSGWSIMQTLGEGAYGEVKLLMNKNDCTTVAMKVVNLQEHPEAKEDVAKEMAIHRMFNDPHIIKYYGQRTEGFVSYIFLEYAPGGELFDKIGKDLHKYETRGRNVLKVDQHRTVAYKHLPSQAGVLFVNLLPDILKTLQI